MKGVSLMEGEQLPMPHVNDEDVAVEMECLEAEVASWWDEVMQVVKITSRLPMTGAAGAVREDLLQSLLTLEEALTDRRVVP